MDKIEVKQELGLVLPALIAHNLLATGKHPDIVKVRAVSPEIADKMESLGYDELTADLFRAFLRSGDLEKVDDERLVDLRGPAVIAFAGA